MQEFNILLSTLIHCKQEKSKKHFSALSLLHYLSPVAPQHQLFFLLLLGSSRSPPGSWDWHAFLLLVLRSRRQLLEKKAENRVSKVL